MGNVSELSPLLGYGAALIRRLLAIVAGLLVLGVPLAVADGTAGLAQVRLAQQRRVEVIRQASRSAVAIFAGDAGGGSGVIISPDGYALTNFHVVQPAGPFMRCGLDDGHLYDAVLVGLDPTGDVALIKLLGRDDFPAAELADSDGVTVGDFCFAAGNPFLLATDLRPSISAGMVSGVHRYQFPAGTILEYADCLQVDAAINPGNSGGGLFDGDGRVIGVNGRASFEKRGRVNVGVGYAISANQLRNFLGLLRGGRLVDHATLGATVSTSIDGRVVVSDILESSDAWRRGLRYDDEVISLAGRPVRTVNAFKNVLGTLPAGWRVPLVYRREGRPTEIQIRLAGVHSSSELAAIVSGRRERKPTEKPGEQPPDEAEEPRAESLADVPDSLRRLYEPRVGFVNHHFNAVERERVAAMIKALGVGDTEPQWLLQGQLDHGASFTIGLDDEQATSDLPTGRSALDVTGELDANPAPPGSGGLLVALTLWRRLLREGPGSLGQTTYWGTERRAWMGEMAGPATAGRGSPPEFVDVLETNLSGVQARFAVASSGFVVGVDVWMQQGSDPCEVRLEPTAGASSPWPPRSFTVRVGDQLFGSFRLEDVRFADPPGPQPAKEERP